jgi:hypothetical protein
MALSQIRRQLTPKRSTANGGYPDVNSAAFLNAEPPESTTDQRSEDALKLVRHHTLGPRKGARAAAAAAARWSNLSLLHTRNPD